MLASTILMQLLTFLPYGGARDSTTIYEPLYWDNGGNYSAILSMVDEKIATQYKQASAPLVKYPMAKHAQSYVYKHA